MSLLRQSRKRWLGYGVGLAILLLVGISLLFMVARKPKPASSDQEVIKVEVLNGCGKPGIAQRFSEFLQKRHFDVVYTGNARAFCFTESMVLDKTGTMAKAEKIAQVLGIPNVIQQINTDPYRREEVTVIIGRDYDSLNSAVDNGVQ